MKRFKHGCLYHCKANTQVMCTHSLQYWPSRSPTSLGDVPPFSRLLLNHVYIINPGGRLAEIESSMWHGAVQDQGPLDYTAHCN